MRHLEIVADGRQTAVSGRIAAALGIEGFGLSRVGPARAAFGASGRDDVTAVVVDVAAPERAGHVRGTG